MALSIASCLSTRCFQQPFCFDPIDQCERLVDRSTFADMVRHVGTDDGEPHCCCCCQWNRLLLTSLSPLHQLTRTLGDIGVARHATSGWCHVCYATSDCQERQQEPRHLVMETGDCMQNDGGDVEHMHGERGCRPIARVMVDKYGPAVDVSVLD